MGFGDLQRGNSDFFLFLFSAYGITCTLYCTQYTYIYIYRYRCTHTRTRARIRTCITSHRITSHRIDIDMYSHKTIGSCPHLCQWKIQFAKWKVILLDLARSPVQDQPLATDWQIFISKPPSLMLHTTIVWSKYVYSVCKIPCSTMVSGVFNIGGTGLILVILLTYPLKKPCTLHPHFTMVKTWPS